jgi:hypothetical protein
MSGAAVRVGVGSRFCYDGEVVEVVEMLATAAGNGAQQRINRMLAIPGYPDLIHAAKGLGVRKAVVAHQVHQLEHAVGTKLLTTALDAAGIRLTAAGEEFAEEVLPVLAMLDRAATEARTSADQKPRSVRAVLPTSERAAV